MRERLDAAYCDLPTWPLPGQSWDHADLAHLAVEWIAANRYFITATVGSNGGGDGWDAGDVISRMAWRAYHGGGLTRSLRLHVDGDQPINNGQALLRYYVRQMARECVAEAAARRSVETPSSHQLPDSGPGGSLLPSPYENDNASIRYQQLIDTLTDDALRHLNDQAPPAIIDEIRSRIPDIWKIFCRTAPAAVVEEVATWPEEHQHLVLLAVFPLRLPHRAVANYRRLAWPQRQTNVSESSTQRQVSRLRARLQQAWPPGLVPRTVRSPESGRQGEREGVQP
jgi:hypothetical protein